jgi:hypothetical protein
MLAGGVLAQDSAPVVVSPRPELTWLDFYYLDASLELEYRRDVSRVDPVVGSDTKDIEDRFRELLELSTRGYVGHPNLLQLDLRGGLRFTQRLVDEETTGIDDNFNEFLFEYDFNGLFFQEQRYPFSIYSRRTQSDIDRLFGGSVEQTWTQTGGKLTVRSETFPTNVEIFVRELEQDDRTFAQDFTLDQKTAQADGRVNIAPTQQMWWDFSSARGCAFSTRAATGTSSSSCGRSGCTCGRAGRSTSTSTPASRTSIEKPWRCGALTRRQTSVTSSSTAW